MLYLCFVSLKPLVYTVQRAVLLFHTLLLIGNFSFAVIFWIEIGDEIQWFGPGASIPPQGMTQTPPDIISPFPLSSPPFLKRGSEGYQTRTFFLDSALPYRWVLAHLKTGSVSFEGFVPMHELTNHIKHLISTLLCVSLAPFSNDKNINN